MKKGIQQFWAIVVVAAMLALTACGSNGGNSGNSNGSDASKTKPAATAAAKTIVFKIAAGVTNDPITHSMDLLKEKLEKNSNGKIKVELYPSNQLGGSAQVLEQVQMGNVQMYVTNNGNLASFNQLIQVLDLPYLFPDFQAAGEYMNNEGSKFVEEIFYKKGLTVLGYFGYGPRTVLSRKAINSLDDLKGMKIRIFPSPVLGDQWNAYGGAGVPMGTAEMYIAFQQGTIDAIEGSAGFFYSGKYFENAKYILMEPNGSQVATFTTSKKWLDSLPADVQKIIRDTVKEIVPKANEYAKNEALESVSKMQKEGGIKVIESSPEFHQKMVGGSEQVYTKLYDRVPGSKEWVKEIQAKYAK